MNAVCGALKLPNDRAVAAPALAEHLSDWAGAGSERRALADLVATIAEAAIPLARRLALARLPGDPAAAAGTNDSGDRQKALDLAAHDHMLAALEAAPVARIVSEEAGQEIALSGDGLFDVAIDPIDGSGSIGIGAPLGLLFAVFPKGQNFQRSGRDVIAAGYLSFGHSTDLGFSLGEGVTLATLDPPSGTFHVVVPRAGVPRETDDIAFNACNRRHFAPPLGRYIDDCLAGADGPRGRNTNMRWLGAAVADLHRILLQGGLFLYPGDGRNGYENGHLRLLYEAFPIAFLMQQAGGAASDGSGPILERTPATIHQKTPLFFGSAAEVARLESYLRC